MKNKKLRNLANSDNGVAGVLIAILMIGLIISFLTFIQTAFVPIWMEQKEAEHMDEVAKQFSQLKFAADTLSISATQSSAISTSITLGNKEIPFFSSSRAYGSIKLLPNNFKIEFKDINDTIYSYQLGTLKYESQNAYFIDQSYNFENGAIILSQPNEGDITFLEPNIFCSGNQITCNLIKLNNIEKEDSITGFGTYPIKLYFLNKLSQSIKSVKSITVYNSHIMAWEKYFDNLLKDNTEISYTKNSNSNDLTLTFEKIGSSVYPDIEVYQTILNIKITST